MPHFKNVFKLKSTYSRSTGIVSKQGNLALSIVYSGMAVLMFPATIVTLIGSTARLFGLVRSQTDRQMLIEVSELWEGISFRS